MKYLVVLLFFVSVVYSHPHTDPPPSEYPVIFFDGYKVNDTFDITKIGTSRIESLECRTDLDSCCASSQGWHRANWYYPNGQQLYSHYAGEDMYQTRGDKKVSLYRRGNHVFEGKYCCVAETVHEHRDNPADKFIGEEVCTRLLNYTKECPSLTAPNNGRVNRHSTTYGSKATFSCNRGYNLTGENVLTCGGGGFWDHDPPTCEDSCPGLMSWSGCGTACPATCENYGRPFSCIVQCVEGCFCPKGYVLHNEKCILPSECPYWCDPLDINNGTIHVSDYKEDDSIYFTCDYGFEAVGETNGTCQANRTWSIRPRCKGCAAKLYVMAFTSTVSNGGSDRHHSLVFSFKDKNVTIPFYNRQGDDMYTNKGDLWTFDLSEYDELPSCFNHRDIRKLAIVATNSDNWHIESVATILSVNTYHGLQNFPLTTDMEANRWIDAYSSAEYERFDLTRYRFLHQCPRDGPGGPGGQGGQGGRGQM